MTVGPRYRGRGLCLRAKVDVRVCLRSPRAVVAGAHVVESRERGPNDEPRANRFEAAAGDDSSLVGDIAHRYDYAHTISFHSGPRLPAVGKKRKREKPESVIMLDCLYRPRSGCEDKLVFRRTSGQPSGGLMSGGLTARRCQVGPRRAEASMTRARPRPVARRGGLREVARAVGRSVESPGRRGHELLVMQRWRSRRCSRRWSRAEGGHFSGGTARVRCADPGLTRPSARR